MTCGEMLDFGDWWFTCQLEEGHDGEHQVTSDDDEAEFRPAYTVRWAPATETVPGEVVKICSGCGQPRHGADTHVLFIAETHTCTTCRDQGDRP